MGRFVHRAVAALLAGLVPPLGPSPAQAAADPEQRGNLAVAQWDVGALEIEGWPLSLRVYYPDADGARPLVVVLHGNQVSGLVMGELSATLASRGFVAVVPDMGNLRQHERAAAVVVGLIDWSLAEALRPGSPLRGRIEPAAIGVAGYSWGGLAVFLAAVDDARIRTVVGLDPVDSATRLAASRLDRLTVPSLHVMTAIDDMCNDDGWEDYAYVATAGPKLRLTVAGSAHCDVEDPPETAVCPVFCTGVGDRATTPLFRRYAVAWLACLLESDVSMIDWIRGDRLDADLASGAIIQPASSGLDGLACQPAGPPVVDAGVGPAADAAPSPVDAGSGGCGCTVRRVHGGAPAGLACLLLLVALWRHRAAKRSLGDRAARRAVSGRAGR